MKPAGIVKTVQKGFTLVELIIVIVILGILAAVAIPKLTSTSDAAYKGTQDATLAALKSAWSVAYATKKGYPTPAEIAAQMQDPTCSLKGGSGNVIVCDKVYKTDGSTQAEFTATPDTSSTVVSTTANLAVTAR